MTATNNGNRKPRGGATYQALKVTGEAAVPLTDYALSGGKLSVDGLTDHLKKRATMELGKGYVVAAADFAVSKSRWVRHANALSRLSVTALTPEGYNILKAAEAVQLGATARQVHAQMSRRLMGYEPIGNRFRLHRETRTYHKLKWGLAGIRLIANRTRIGRAITKPIRENVLRELGASA